MNSNKKIRIGCGQGFWGDWIAAPKKIVTNGNLDYLILDYLAEVTMSILAKQKAKDPNLGYGKDFPDLFMSISDDVLTKNLKIITNAGGLNPLMCAKECINKFQKKHPNTAIPKIAVVLGDDLTQDIDNLIKNGLSFNHLENGKDIKEILTNLKSVNAYIGSESVVEALNNGAQIVLTGRIADPSMCLAPLISEFKWSQNDWDKVASGIVAGHIIECGAQSTGGNFSYDWKNVPEPWDIGYPIIECSEDGSFIVTKPEGSGGVVSTQSIKEQLVYEISDPKNYYTPDVIVDFTSLKIEEIAKNKVKVTNAKGKEKPKTLKISATYHSGYKAEGTLILIGPDVLKKAEICKSIIEKRLLELNLSFEEIIFENLGTFSCIPGMAEKLLYPEPGEIVFRVAVKDSDKTKVSRFTREVAPLVLSGPSGITGYAGGKGEVKEVISFWPSLIDSNLVKTNWSFVS